jgi:ABC-2 type transport system permease protein
MFRHVLAFEIRYQARRLSIHVTFLLLFAYAALMVVRAAGLAGPAFDLVGDGGATHLNSPYVLYLLVTLPSFFGIVAVAAVMANAACREARHRSEEIYDTKPVSRRAFLLGRYAGGVVALAYVFTAPALGALAATLLPTFPAPRLGPFRLDAILMPYAAIVAPNLLALGAILFALAARARREASTYAVTIGLLAAFLLARALGPDLERAGAAALLDPFGYVAGNAVMDRIWTVTTRNTTAVRLEGALLVNRLLWLGIGAAALGLVLTQHRIGALRRPRPVEPTPTDSDRRTGGAATLARPSPARAARLVAALAAFETRAIFRGWPFRAAVLLLLAVGTAMARTIGTFQGTPSHPVTFLVLGDLSNSLLPLMLLFILFQAGEIVWREREIGQHELVDSAPASTCQLVSAKALALLAVVLTLLAVTATCGIGAQLARGHVRIEPSVYALELLAFRLPTYLLFAALATAVHVLAGHKYLGHFLTASLYLTLSSPSLLGGTHGLLRYASDPGWLYSDFNGYGHFAWPFAVFKAYWAAFAVLLGLGTLLLWPRGAETGLSRRLRLARHRSSRRVMAVAALAGVTLVTVGLWIHRNTVVLNPTPSAKQAAAAEYEARYRELASVAQPKVTAVALDVDLRPEDRRCRIVGCYTLLNKGAEPLRSVHLSRGGLGDLTGVRADRRWTASTVDERLGYFVYDLDEPLQPGRVMSVSFEVELRQRGFSFPESAEGVVANGTLLMNGDWAPHVGYHAGRELTDPLTRLRFGLPARPALASAADALAATRGARRDSDRVAFEAIVRTAPDQIAVAPGRLEREWTEAGRRCFAFRAERPIWNHYGIISGRLEVRRETLGDVALEVYFHPEHGFNVDRVVRALRESLAWHARSFGPYPYSVARVVEVPRYAPFASRSYPGLIPCSETRFLTRVEEEREVDTLSSLVAHEVGHQWWGHAAAGAAVEGGPLVQESLAQYSRLKMVETLQGDAAARRLLDEARASYFRGRSGAGEPETPLVRVGYQPYVFYDRGLLAMHRLSRALGESWTSATLADYLTEVSRRDPPYATSLDLLAHLKGRAPEGKASLVSDLFEHVVTHEIRVLRATCSRIGERYRVEVGFSLRKLRADQDGIEGEVPADDWVEVGLYDARGAALLVQPVRVDRSPFETTFELDTAPSRVEVDPARTLVEADRDDNSADVTGGATG